MLIKSSDKVQKLTQRVEKIYDQRQADEDRLAREQARLKQVMEADEITKTDFWCRKHGDTTGIAYKVSFKTKDGWCAYYETFGTGWPQELMACCKWLRRNITDKNWDTYYRDSDMIRLQQRQALANGDLLQPGMEGFITKYGDPNKKKYAQLEKEERALWNSRQA